MTEPRATSLRNRLLLGTSLATAGILVGAGLLVYVSVRASLLGEFDRALGSGVHALAALTEQDERGVRMEPAVADMAEFSRKKTPDYFAAWLADDKLVASSASLGGRALPHPAPALGMTITRAVTLPDGLPGRQTTLNFAPAFEDPQGRTTPGTRTVTLSVARHTRELDLKLFQLACLLAGVGATATLGAACTMVWVVRRALRPVGVIATRISAIDRDNLGGRIEPADTPAELRTIVLRLNELLDRVEQTVARERRFSADVAHELRTPLSGLGAILDVCAMRPRTPGEYERTLAKCLRIVRGMHGMVDTLMTLSRAEGNGFSLAITAVPLASLVRDCWSSFEAAAAARELSASFDVDPGLGLETDAHKLRIVLNNLFDNAVCHADTGGWLKVEARADGERVELCCSNSGSALSDAQAPRAFDRFWRGDAARVNTGVHCGLGLSLCREIVAILSGEIAATSAPGGVFEVRINLPRVVPRQPRPDAAGGNRPPPKIGTEVPRPTSQR